MPFRFIRPVLIALFTTAALLSSAWGDTNWQLVFRYDAGSLQLVKADPIGQTAKKIETPGLHSAAFRIAYDCDWLDGAGESLLATSTELPLGVRSPIGDSEAETWYVPESGYVVVRLNGPDVKDSPESLRLSRTGVSDKTAATVVLPAAFETERWSFRTAAAMAAAAPTAGPVSATKIRDTGPDANRLVIVVMGDGYTAANLASGAFTTAAASLGASIEAKSPWTTLFAATNMYRVDVESNESGTDNETLGVYKDTYLHSSFWVNDIERLLALTGTGYYNAIQAADAMVGAGVWDMILVLVNSTKYGGSGGSIAVSSVNSSAAEIVIHEMGHTIAHLADEYESAYPGYPAGDSEPNVDYDYSGSGLKWLIWVDAGTPLPTPEASPYLTTVGAFEGARYLTTGIYRPWYNCEMRALNRPFCPVCQEAHVISFTQRVSLLDGLVPANGTSTNVSEAGALFTATPLPLAGLEYTWRLNGVVIADSVNPTLSLTPEMMTGPDQTLTLTVTMNTPLVRKTTISTNYSWPVHRIVASCCAGIVGDANNDGGYEPTIGDISALIDHLFISQIPLTCYEEADINQSGGFAPDSLDITIGDISALIDYLFISGAPLDECL